MIKLKTLFALGLVFFSLSLFSQQKDSTRVRLNHYTITVGTGWTHFFNNLENGDQNIKNDFVGATFKFFWEPEHRLSLGLETGYYKLFRITEVVNQDTSVQIDRSLVPFLLLVRMRIINNVYLGAGIGISILTNKASGAGEEINTKMNSLSNFEFTGSYIYPLSKHWLVGGDMKVFHSGTMDDWLLSIQATFAFRL
jgi:hypothetical protein